MISTAGIRVFGIRSGHDKDNHNWQIFWQLAEACIAVMMVCLSAFRSFYVAHESRLRGPRNRPWYMSRRKVLPEDPWKKGLGIESYDMKRFPHIPQATLTGMRTIIRGQNWPTESMMETEQSSKGSGLYRIGRKENSDDSQVDKSITVQTEEVRSSPGHFHQSGKL